MYLAEHSPCWASTSICGKFNWDGPFWPSGSPWSCWQRAEPAAGNHDAPSSPPKPSEEPPPPGRPPDREEVDRHLTMLGYDLRGRLAEVVHRVIEHENEHSVAVLSSGLATVIEDARKARRGGEPSARSSMALV